MCPLLQPECERSRFGGGYIANLGKARTLIEGTWRGIMVPPTWMAQVNTPVQFWRPAGCRDRRWLMALEPKRKRELDDGSKEFVEGADYTDRKCDEPRKGVSK